MMLMAAVVMVTVGVNGNDGDGDEYGNADSNDGNAGLPSLCPHPSVFRPSLHSPSMAQDFHVLLLGASALANSSQLPILPGAMSCFLTSDGAKSMLSASNLGHRNKGLYHGRGCWQYLRLQVRRRA